MRAIQESIALCAAALSVAVLSACAAEPQDDGSCKISCSKPAIGSSSYRIQNMLPVDMALTCQGEKTGTVVASNRPLMIAFRLVESGTDLSSGDPFPARTGDTDQPVPGVAFEPVVTGAAMNTLATNPEHLTTNAAGETVASPAKFEGIVTPQSEWCSDSCGVMRFEIAPVCITGASNDVSAGVFVGGSLPSDFVTIPITGSVAGAATE